jgi:XTP/dITP diphosphohydrolase/tetrapyrrole methylase family protein/MazG family protein/ATP diphosphatase
VSAPDAVAAAVARLDELTRRLRRECPWDREQDERSIVPHTVEEAYELADAAQRGDDVKLLDELGDVLFQVHFLSLLLEERGAGDLAAVADHCREKLIRRHPHVFPEAASRGVGTGGDALPEGATGAATAGDVLRNWDAIKATERGREAGLFGDVPEGLPALLHARKVQRRAASSGFDFPGVEFALEGVRAEADEVEQTADGAGADAERGAAAPDEVRDALFREVGDLLFAAVNVARKLRVDPELALRSSSGRFAGRVEAAAELARGEGATWSELSPERQLGYYAQVRLRELED